MGEPTNIRKNARKSKGPCGNGGEHNPDCFDPDCPFDAPDPHPLVTADHTPERLSADDRETLEKRVREWMRSTSESYIQPVGSDAWVRGLVGYLASGPNSVDRILAAHLADVEARLASRSAAHEPRCSGPANAGQSGRTCGPIYCRPCSEATRDWVTWTPEHALIEPLAALHPAPSEGGDRG